MEFMKFWHLINKMRSMKVNVSLWPKVVHKLLPQANNVRILTFEVPQWASCKFLVLERISFIFTSHYMVVHLGQQKLVWELDHWWNWVASTLVTLNPIWDTPQMLTKTDHPSTMSFDIHFQKLELKKLDMGQHKSTRSSQMTYHSQILIVDITSSCASFSFQRDQFVASNLL